MTFVDTNVLIDIFDRDLAWLHWSASKLAEVDGDIGVVTNTIVIAELSSGYPTVTELRAKLSEIAVAILPLNDESAFMAGKRFQAFRRAREAGDDARVLPDFLIGAHALILNRTLLTRDPRLYRRYFPELALITPETQP